MKALVTETYFLSRLIFAGTVYRCSNVCIYTFIQFEINAVPLPRAISPLVETFQTPPRISKQLAAPYLLPERH